MKGSRLAHFFEDANFSTDFVVFIYIHKRGHIPQRKIGR